MIANSELLRGAILLATLLLLAAEGRAQDEHVYLIKMFDCAHKPVERLQTGFRVRGLKGIITALHGVADCQLVKARSRKGLILDQPLKIIKADIDRDVAILSSPQLDSMDGGFEPASTVVWEPLGTVKVYGHPYGLRNLETTLWLRTPPLKPLKDLVPESTLSFLIRRQSPSHLINVLSLQGNLLPGHSGAPIIDASGRIVAVANGGLKEGFAGISWAVPFQDIEWDGPSSRLRALGQADPHILFAFDSTPAESIAESESDFCGQLSRIITASYTGFISLVGDPYLDHLPGTFKSKIELPGASYGLVGPPESVSYFMYETDKIGKIESQYYTLVNRLSACLPAWKRKERVISNGPRLYMFRENDKGPIVDAYYETELNEINKKYTLVLHIRAPSDFLKQIWN